ncbi:hypothetical protein [Anaeromicropila populeti]|uniref:Uncharacterized protein n=1 Tax=Anaeromicropila populeti TaxID=37658 RepID=A0A1I6LXF7_9FIRM|nr:hypothetical protein [Anaeromicropila populeti]SFS08064.1 hypothetical protein SAMN05661086_03643 [Anaeromicropila populeti]
MSRNIVNQEINVIGLWGNMRKNEVQQTNFRCIVTNTNNGKTLSICKMDEKIEITIPFEPLEKYLL